MDVEPEQGQTVLYKHSVHLLLLFQRDACDLPAPLSPAGAILEMTGTPDDCRAGIPDLRMVSMVCGARPQVSGCQGIVSAVQIDDQILPY